MRSTFKLLFYINRQKVKKNGKCPIMGRITLDGKVSQYSTGLEIEPVYWDADAGKAIVDGRKENLAGEKKKELFRLTIPCPHWKPKPVSPIRKMWTAMASCRLKSSRMP